MLSLELVGFDMSGHPIDSRRALDTAADVTARNSTRDLTREAYAEANVASTPSRRSAATTVWVSQWPHGV